MIAIISLVNAGLGFLNGYLIARFLMIQKVDKLEDSLTDLVESKIETDEEISSLKHEVDKLKCSRDMYRQVIDSVKTSISSINFLPPPSTPIQRESQVISEDNMD